MSTTIDATTGRRSRTSHADAARSMEAAKLRERRSAEAYQAGLEGDELGPLAEEHEHQAWAAGAAEAARRAGREGRPLREGATDEERAAHRAGRAERARSPQRRSTTRAGHPRGRLGYVPPYVAARGRKVARQASGGNWTVMGLTWGVLGLCVLYLLLTRANAVSGVLNGATGVLRWFVNPQPLPL